MSHASAVPRFSIVVPSYNQGRYLERCLRSIVQQDYPDLELIVIDGGSTDDSLAILERYRGRITHLVSEADRGQSDALNKGFALASGEVFGWQNADDLYTPGAFRAAAALFRDRPELQVAYSNYREIDEEDRVTQVYYALAPSRPTFAYATCDIATQAMFWRRAAHQAFGGFDVAYQRCMDSHLKLHFLTRHSPPGILRVEGCWGCFRRHSSQKTNAGGLDQRNLAEESSLARRFGYQASDAATARLDRLAYRGRQMRNALEQGGVRYAVQRLFTGMKRRRSLW